MTPYKSIAKDNEEGDCFRTSLAMILNVHPSEVPHFGELYKDQPSFHDEVDQWLAQFGLAQGHSMLAPDEILEMIPTYVNNISPGVPAMVSGRTATGGYHTVVVCDGKWYDPSPIREWEVETALTGPCLNDDDSPQGYWIAFVAVAKNFKLPNRGNDVGDNV